MEKYGSIIFYVLLGVAFGSLVIPLTRNLDEANLHTTSSTITAYSNDFYYNPKVDDIYFITDTLSSERTALYAFGITKDSIAFSKIVDLDNFDPANVVGHMAHSRMHKTTMKNNFEIDFRYFAIDQLSPEFLWEQGKSLIIYRTYPNTKFQSTLQAFSSSLSIIVVLISFLIIWFGSTIKNYISLNKKTIIDTVYIILIIVFFYTFNPIYFTLSGFEVLFSIFSVAPIYLFFQRFKKTLFSKQYWIVREVYKFMLIVFFGSLFQLLSYKICIEASFRLSKDPLNYINGIRSMVIDGTGLLWLFIAIGNFLNNARKNLADAKHRIKEAQLKAQQSKAELDALQSKVNPHFLYNSLNSIAGLAQEDPAKTEEMAIALSHFYKQSTNRQGEHWNTIEEALELLQTYLGIEKIRFGDRLQFDIQCPESLKEEKIPRFLIQPLVENAIKYGYQASTNSITIRLELEKIDNQLLIRLFDQGPPFPDNLQSGYGVQSVQKKLELLYPDRYELAFINLPEKQVVITLGM